jgi:hypothetical protein
LNPLLQQSLFSILRFVLAIGAGYLVRKGIWEASAAQTYVEAAALAILSLAWSQRTVWMNYVRQLVALTLHKGSTMDDVQAHIASGITLPSVMTPTNTAPGVPSTLTT